VRIHVIAEGELDPAATENGVIGLRLVRSRKSLEERR
jgi:hypothetical protein